MKGIPTTIEAELEKELNDYLDEEWELPDFEYCEDYACVE